jgi:hypothetical protein
VDAAPFYREDKREEHQRSCSHFLALFQADVDLPLDIESSMFEQEKDTADITLWQRSLRQQYHPELGGRQPYKYRT